MEKRGRGVGCGGTWREGEGRGQRVEERGRRELRRRVGGANWRKERVGGEEKQTLIAIYRNGRRTNENWVYEPMSVLIGCPILSGSYPCQQTQIGSTNYQWQFVGIFNIRQWYSFFADVSEIHH